MFTSNRKIIKSPPEVCEPRTVVVEKDNVIYVGEWSLQREGYVLDFNDAHPLLFGDETYEDIVELCQQFIS